MKKLTNLVWMTNLVIATALASQSAFFVKEHRPGLGPVLCYYRDQDNGQHVISLPNGSVCPPTIVVSR